MKKARTSTKELLWVVVALLSSLLLPDVSAQTSLSTLPFQGKLTDVAGNATNGTHDFVIRLYADGADPIGTEIFYDQHLSVKITNGLYALRIGRGFAADGTKNLGIPESVLLSKTNLFLGLQIDSDLEMTPRTQLSAVPLAMRAVVADKRTSGPARVDSLDVTGAVKVGGVTALAAIEQWIKTFLVLLRALTLAYCPRVHSDRNGLGATWRRVQPRAEFSKEGSAPVFGSSRSRSETSRLPRCATARRRQARAQGSRFDLAKVV